MSNWYTTQITEGPTEETVTAEELHEHLSLNVELSAVEDLLNLYLSAARELFEHDTGLCVATQTLTQYQACWETPVRLFRGPVQDVTSVKYYDTSDTLQTLTNWDVDLTGTPALVYRTAANMGQTFPAVSPYRPRPIEIEYIAGVDAEYAEAGIKLCIKLLAGHYYNQREAFGEVDLKSVPMGWDRLTAKYSTGLKGW